ncbi:fatty acid desaturase protein [Rutstroemia sp. NJR-2017a BVV2]|nr:fatty acid desaturase protein [Rutstroemia sp. NJR-2017a BVV2]
MAAKFKFTMTLDFTSHPTELVKGGEVPTNAKVTIKDLRVAIPDYCFQPSYRLSFWYLFRDLVVATSTAAIAYFYIPLIETPLLRYAAWSIYGAIQGLTFTGLWVLGHECGHSAFSPSNALNDTLGWLLHSFLLTPYFSWQSSHRRHHIYANHLVKDHNYVPLPKYKYAAALSVNVDRLEEMTEDSPIYTLLRIVMQQLFGFPWYLMANITASQGALNGNQSGVPFGNSHFSPVSSLFRPEEAHLILLSDIGIGLVLYGLWHASQILDSSMIALLYFQPYLWVNHWIVAITYLHHTHPDVPKYEPEAWNFLKGALATVDRDLGWAGKHMLHNIAEFHVIHHLFSRIPQYHAEEATKAIMPLLGASYHADKKRNFWKCMWEAFTKCQYVVPDDEGRKQEERTMIYKGGPSPAPEFWMSQKGWSKQ